MNIKQIFHNFSWKLSGALIGGSVNFLYSILLMRELGPTLFGQISFALGWASFFAIFVEFGMNPILTRDLSIQSGLGKNYFSIGLKIRFKLLLVGLVSLILISLLTAKTRSMLGLLIAAFFFLTAVSITDFNQAITYAYEKFKAGALFFVAHKFLGAFFGISALYLGLGVVGIVSFSAAGGWMGAIAASIYFFWFLSSRGSNEIARDRTQSYFLKEAYPIFLTVLLGALYFRIDTIFLGYMTTDKITGVYNSAYRFFEVVNIIPAAYVASIQSRLARSAESNEFFGKFWKSTTGMVGLIVLVSTGLFFVSHLLPIILSNPGYKESGPLLRILIFAIPPYFINILLVTTLTFQKKQSKMALLTLVGLVFNMVTNLYAIPRWQAQGAAVTTCISEVLVMLLYLKAVYTPKSLKN